MVMQSLLEIQIVVCSLLHSILLKDLFCDRFSLPLYHQGSNQISMQNIHNLAGQAQMLELSHLHNNRIRSPHIQGIPQAWILWQLSLHLLQNNKYKFYIKQLREVRIFIMLDFCNAHAEQSFASVSCPYNTSNFSLSFEASEVKFCVQTPHINEN